MYHAYAVSAALHAEAQQLFDQITRGLLNQCGPARDMNGSCAYRGHKGRKCGVGHVITDEQYKPEMEGKVIRILVDTTFPQWKEHEALLSTLQRVHDSSVDEYHGSEDYDSPTHVWTEAEREQLKGALKGVAYAFGLSTYVVNMPYHPREEE